ncbi:hypothetical protein [Salisediminibacterium halotolerans]|uniref:hypothetical protein n=1 Tax=Salisediminibacterium halotolerans TaxID=517425 RepID=UPI000EB476EB|nr:hypothetical protein [Salisediminibacterium halotolerans]RLJ74085.1 hypothetical protein BCL39_1370 [Actinophytocola xinjiangensis]RPE87822.1 hypothetical protein EDD67_1561 [Salisediminibacterium halotolerans]TWG34922.1 hypothetical protein BCL52_1367 [Salisediminibacterium halotolerans]GEL07891.1 hypothetical protein SHA02_13070 [Salisediminibacterium halotolerans]
MSLITGYAAALLFALNLSMYALFYIIRKSSSRRVRIYVARYTRQIMKSHSAVGIAGSFAIILHIYTVTDGGSFFASKPVYTTGVVAGAFLILTLLSGYLRSRKANGFRRRNHQRASLFFTLTVIVHITMSSL